MERLEALFQQTVSRITLTNHVKRKAWQSYVQVYNVNEAACSENPIEWFVVHVYLALLEQAISSSQLTRQTTDVTVSHLLNVSKMHCKEFITKLKFTMEQTLASPLTEDVVNELVRSYVLTAALYDKCSRIFTDIYVEECSSTVDPDQPNYYTHLCAKKQTIWLLHLLAREEKTFNMSELVTSFYVLLCCFIPVLKSTPAFLLRPPWGGLCSNQLGEQEKTNLLILQKLCAEYKVDLSEVFVPILQSTQWSEFMAKHSDVSPPLLKKEWRALVRPLSLDGLDFIDAPSLVIPSNPTRNLESASSEVPPTPVQFRLNTIQHLKNILGGISDCPGEGLRQHFMRCIDNPEEVILLRLREMGDRYVNGYLAQHPATQSLPSHRSSSQNDIPTQRFSLITRLYLRVLQTLLEQEQERLSKTDFSTLLQIDTFHRSLVTCCALVVNHTYNEQTPARESLESLLDTFRIEAYHMCKVIECFIKAEPELSKASIHHLKLCENYILETLAWKHDSPLYDVLVLPTSTGPADVPHVSPNEILTYNIGAAQFLTPPRRRVQDRPLVENGVPPRSRSLAVFINKVCRLAYHRLQLLCNTLTIPREVVPKIWTCLEYCIKSRGDLLRGRHLDQIIMCCLYAISRVNKEVKFKTIVSAYEKLPHRPSSAIYKRVQMSEPSITSSIITFYNHLYMQSMKTYILQFSPDRRPATLSTAPMAGHSPLKSSPRKMSHNVFISPMKSDNATKLHMTPRSDRLYCFGDVEGTKQLQSINDSIKQASTPPSATKRLTFDEGGSVS